MILDSIARADVDIKRELFGNIILTGGTTMIKNFSERLQKILPDVAPQNIKVKVISAPERRFQSWVGGSILSSINNFQSMWITKSEYEESGPSVVHRKCF